MILGYLEESHLKTLRDTLVKVEGVEGDQTGRHQNNNDISPQFFISKEGLDPPEHEKVIEVKIDTENQNAKTDKIGN